MEAAKKAGSTMLLGRGEGKKLQVLSDLVCIKIRGEETEGASA